MFTGIIEEIGTVASLPRASAQRGLVVQASGVLSGVALGDSVCVDGVCLTVTELGARHFTVGLMEETLRRSTLGSLRPGDQVNLERALTPTSRLGGHFVQGHVDATGVIQATAPEGEAVLVTISAPPEVMRYAVEKGFIAVDGASLTVVRTSAAGFVVSLIGFTQSRATLAGKSAGTRVNLEVDILAKYVERMISQRAQNGSAVTAEMLLRTGFM